MLRFLIVLSIAAIVGGASPAQRESRFTKYFIYTQTNINNGIELDLTADPSPLKAGKNTTIIIHGHQGSGKTSLNPTVKNAFLRSQDINVIVVDWALYAGQSYNTAILAVENIAKGLENVINQLVTKELVNLEKLHLVGFDLGAHVAGYVGRALNGEVARITGLDPSKEQGGNRFQRLRITDAKYVEVLHTDGIGALGYGIGDAIGHADFYINGGTNQPGCPFNHWCSHNRAWEVFAATLNSRHLVGHQCGTWLQVTLNTCRGFTLEMGGNDYSKYGEGMYRVNTRRTFPY